jgi:hypothetical protein
MSLPTGVQLTIDETRNVLRVRFHGHVTAATLQAEVDQIKASLPRMRAGFTVFTDLSDLDAMELDCVDSLTRMMELFKGHGVALVVRAIPDPAKDIGFNILSLTHYRRGVQVITCRTLAEAERALPGEAVARAGGG